MPTSLKKRVRVSHRAVRLDDVDLRILKILSRDGRTSYADLAEAAGLTAAGVKKRVLKMTRAGTLSVCGRVKMEHIHSASALVNIEIDSRHIEAFLEAAAELPGVYLLTRVYDAHNVVLGVVASSLPDIDRFLDTHVVSLPGVRDVVVHVTDLPRAPAYV